MDERVCGTCARWSEGAYCHAYGTKGTSFGTCLWSETADGTPKHPSTVIVAEGTFGENFAAVRSDHTCRNWKERR